MADQAQSTASSPNLKDAFRANRQAVIVIHGIGQQRPMDTLRPFVDAVLGVDPGREQQPLYYSAPDDASATFELRRLQTRDSRPRTDFYELYWQHLMPTATWGRIVAWLALLLRRNKSDVPPALYGLWAGTRVLVGIAALLLVWSIVLWLFPNLWPSESTTAADATLPLGLAVILLAVQATVLNYIGDAAVYLSPDPQNIAARQAVREAGVALIERLHADNRYDRIVLVGHSLGSVIGYDILTFAWPRFRDRHGTLDRPVHDALHAAESAARELRDAHVAKANADELRRLRDRWQVSSRQLWLEQRANEFPWLVTDFITLGSPLAHSLLLLARSRAEFERKKLQSELPTSPPRLGTKSGFSYGVNYQREDGSTRTARVINFGAVFALTRWTNLYFPAWFGLKGDLIGGPIAGELGPGIVDVPVTTSRNWLAHTKYWRPFASDAHDRMSAIVKLREALDLSRKRFMEPARQRVSTVHAETPEQEVAEEQ